MRSGIIIIGLLLTTAAFSQKKTASISFLPKFGSSFLNTETYYKTGSDSFLISELKFYISNIELWNDHKLAWKEKKSFHLVDINDASSLKIQMALPAGIHFNEIRFDLGIDSLTNVSGAMGGALDPIRGMYWTWQSGYINLKLEGKSNLCKTRNNEFQFHLGGYQKPFYNLQHITIKPGNKENVEISIDCKQIMSVIDLRVDDHIMSPSKEAVLVSGKIASILKTL